MKPLGSSALPSAAILGMAVVSALFLALAGSIALAAANRGCVSSDLAMYANSLYNTAHGHCLLCNDFQLLRQGYPSYLNEHFAPTLLLLTPLGLLRDPSLSLIWVQLLCPLSLAWALFEAGRSAGGAGRGLGLAALWLLNPLLLRATVDWGFGFHVDMLALPCLAMAYLGALKGRPGWTWSGLLLLAGVKEDLALMLAFAAAAAWIFRLKTPVPAALWALASLAVALGGPALSLITQQPSALFSWAGSGPRPAATWRSHLGLFAPLLLLPGWWTQPWSLLALLHGGAFAAAGDEAWKVWHVLPGLGGLGLAAVSARPARYLKLWIPVALALTLWQCHILLGQYQAVLLEAQPFNRADALAASRAIPEGSALATTTSLLPCAAGRRHLLWPDQDAGAEYWLLQKEVHRITDPPLWNGVLRRAKLGQLIRLPDPSPDLALFRLALCLRIPPPAAARPPQMPPSAEVPGVP